MFDVAMQPERVNFVLRVLAARGLKSKLRRQILTDYVEEAWNPANTIDHLRGRYDAKNESLEAISSVPDQSSVVERLASLGIKLLIAGDGTYPGFLSRVLNDAAPPVLFCLGNLELLNQPGVGFCGARDASSRGIDIAEKCARLLAWLGINVVSGYARGVDAAVHRAALDAGATTTVVLPEGILGFSVRRELKNSFDLQRTLVLSQFQPGLPWKTWHAMERNHTICGLADAVIVIEARDRGGTLAAGLAAIKRGFPLFVVEYENSPLTAVGNEELISLGAKRLRQRPSGEPSLDGILNAMKTFHLGQKITGSLF